MLLVIESAIATGQASLFGDGVLGFDPEAASPIARRADPALAWLIDEVGPYRARLRRATGRHWPKPSFTSN